MKIIDTTKTKLMSYLVITIAGIASASLATVLLMETNTSLPIQVISYVGITLYYIALSVSLIKIRTSQQPEQLELEL